MVMGLLQRQTQETWSVRSAMQISQPSPILQWPVAAHLGHPFEYELRREYLEPDDALRQIELAETRMKFSGGSVAAERALARWNFERVLRLLPHELQRTHAVNITPGLVCERSLTHYASTARRSVPRGLANAHRHTPPACSRGLVPHDNPRWRRCRLLRPNCLWPSCLLPRSLWSPACCVARANPQQQYGGETCEGEQHQPDRGWAHDR